MDEKSKDETGEKLKKDVIPGYKSIDDFTKVTFKSLKISYVYRLCEMHVLYYLFL